MEIEFSKAKRMNDGDTWLCLQVADAPEIATFLDEMVDDKTYIANLKIKRNKRSLDANAYMWKLCDKIASVLNSTKETVYKMAVMQLGDMGENIYTYVAVSDEAVEDFIEVWQKQGLGNYVEVTQECKLEGCKKLMCYKGSSHYDTKQMSRLIDLIVEDAKELEIETLTPAELSLMKENWRGQNDKATQRND